METDFLLYVNILYLNLMVHIQYTFDYFSGNKKYPLFSILHTKSHPWCCLEMSPSADGADAENVKHFWKLVSKRFNYQCVIDDLDDLVPDHHV